VNIRLWLTGLLLWLSCSTAIADTWQYTIRPGDDLWSLAKKHCGSSSLAPRIAQHNKLNNPAALRVGQRIEIPTDWLVFEPSAARVTQLIGKVFIERSTSAGRTPLKVGDAVPMGATLITGDNAAAQIEFADGSTIAVQAGSRVLFNKLTAFGPAGMVDTHLRFSYGRGEVSVKPQNRGDRFRVQTPEGIAAVRGTTFRIGHRLSAANASSVSNSETLTGAISFLQAAVQTPVPAGFGVAASPTGLIKEALLEAPSVPAYPRVAVDTELNWRALPGAAEYVTSWVRKSAPAVIYRQSRVSEPRVRVVVEPDNYELRVRGVSAAGIEGFDHVQQVNVASPSPQPKPINEPFTAGGVRLEWALTSDNAYTVTISGDNLREPIVQDVAARHLELPLAPGAYKWTVAGLSSVPSPPANFTVIPEQPADLRATTKRDATGTVVDLHWSGKGESFALEVVQARTGAVVYQTTVRDDAHQFHLQDYGHYLVNLAAEQNNLRSETATTEIRLYQRPWWLFILLLPVAAL
jgi:hypothetical protein